MIDFFKVWGSQLFHYIKIYINIADFFKSIGLGFSTFSLYKKLYINIVDFLNQLVWGSQLFHYIKKYQFFLLFLKINWFDMPNLLKQNQTDSSKISNNATPII
jgi:hypothetical protein